jgi:Fic family protein
MDSNLNNIDQEFEIIKSTLRQFKEGASIEEIRTISGLDIGLRTLQRRLAKLREQGQITTSGGSHALLYHLIQSETDNEIQAGKDLLPLTNEGKEILSIVSLPEQQRKPVGYNRNFLESYRPNIDSYLRPEELKKLAEIGNTATLDQPAGTYAKEILNRLLIDLSWNSSRLEGNTYTLLDTQRLISYGQIPDNRSPIEEQMILNHKEAIEFIIDAADELGFSRHIILSIHALLSNNLLPDPAASGRLRTFGIGIHQSVYIPLAIPQQIDELFALLLAKAEQIQNPFEQAFFIMVQLPYLQPFDDVNKRVSRLAANIPLVRYNLAPLSFVDVPNDPYIKGMIGVYELNRVELLRDVFMWAYERSAARYATVQQSIGQPDTFRLKYRKEIRTLIAEIVSNAIPPREASAKIEAGAEQLPEKDRSRFIESVDTELLSLHAGNFARYQVRPAEFNRWVEVWTHK